MAEYLIQDTTLTEIADAIRAKTGQNELINPSDMPSIIEGISGTITTDQKIIDIETPE